MAAKKECGLIKDPEITIDTVTHHSTPGKNSPTPENEWTTFESQGELCDEESCPLSIVDRKHIWESDSLEEVVEQVQKDIENAQNLCPRIKRSFLQNLAFQLNR